MAKVNVLDSVIILFIIIIFSLSVSGFLYSTKKMVTNLTLYCTGIKTTGRISGKYTTYSNDKRIGSTKTYRNIIEYNDNKGKLHELISDYSSSIPDNIDVVNVYYNKSKPFRAIEGSFYTIFLLPFLIFCFSLLGLIVSINFGQPIFVYLKKKIFQILRACLNFTQ